MANSLWDLLCPDLENDILELAAGLVHREKMREIVWEMPIWDIPGRKNYTDYPWGESVQQYHNPFFVSVIPSSYNRVM